MHSIYVTLKYNVHISILKILSTLHKSICVQKASLISWKKMLSSKQVWRPPKVLFRLSLQLSIDPLGRPTDPAGSDHYFRTDFRTYVHPHFSKYSKKTKQMSGKNNYHTGGTVGLAEGIIDDTAINVLFVFLSLQKWCLSISWPESRRSVLPRFA